MDIEKLIEQLNGYFEGKDLKRGVALDTATALSTLQIENQALRNAASGFKAENEKLREMYQKEKAVCHATQAKLDQMKRENETLKHALQNWHEED
jgi:hypothetical protein